MPKSEFTSPLIVSTGRLIVQGPFEPDPALVAKNAAEWIVWRVQQGDLVAYGTDTPEGIVDAAERTADTPARTVPTTGSWWNFDHDAAHVNRWRPGPATATAFVVAVTDGLLDVTFSWSQEVEIEIEGTS